MRRRGPSPDRVDESLGSRAFGGAVWGTAQTLILLPVNFLGSLLVARFLGPGDLGAFVALMVFLTISGPVLDFGFGAAMQQWTGAAVASGDSAQMKSLFRKALGFHLLVQQPGVLLAAAFLLRDSPSYYVWVFAALSITGASLGSVDFWLAAHNRLALGAKRSLIAGVLGNVVLVVVAASGGTPELMWLSRFAVQLLPSLAVLFALTPEDRQVLLRPALPRRLPEGFWTFARPMWLTVMLGALLSTRSEVFLLRGNGLEVQAGVFAIAFGLAIQVTGPFAGVHSSFGAVAVTLSTGPPERLARALASGNVLFGVLASLALAAAAGLPRAVVPLYGSAYATAVPLVLPLVMAATLRTSLDAFGAGALVRRQRGRLLSTQAIAVVLDLGVAACLVPIIGLPGAAIGAALGLIAVNLGLLLAELGPGRAVTLLARSPWLQACVCCVAAISVTASVPDGWPGVFAASALSLSLHVLLLRLVHRRLLVELLEWLGPRLPHRARALLAAAIGVVPARPAAP